MGEAIQINNEHYAGRQTMTWHGNYGHGMPSTFEVSEQLQQL